MAEGTKCIANLRQVDIGFLMYCNDDSDWVPVSHSTTADLPYVTNWVAGVMTYGYTGSTNAALLVNPIYIMFRPIKRVMVWACLACLAAAAAFAQSPSPVTLTIDTQSPYMHWWAAHNAKGVNFQNTEWLATDTFHPDASGNYHINPKAYGIKAFDLGGHGRVETVVVANADNLDLTAYAVGTATDVCVTIINKEHGPGARAASVTIRPEGFFPGDVRTMFLEAPGGDVGATNGITLGGAPIVNDAPWQGHWTVLDPPNNSPCVLTVPAASAVVVKMAQR